MLSVNHAVISYISSANPPRTVPQPVSAQFGLDSDVDRYRAHSAPAANIDALPPGSPDSSEEQSRASSNLSNISEAQVAEDQDGSLTGSAKGSGDGSNMPPPLPNAEPMDPLELLSGSAKTDSKTHSGGPMPPMPLTPRPGYTDGSPAGSGQVSRSGSAAGSRPGSMGSGRPGSERHRVLPPISPQPQALPEY